MLNRQVTFTGQAPLTAGQGYPPRGLFVLVNTKAEDDTIGDNNTPCLSLEGQVTNGFPLQADGKTFVEDTTLAGRQIFDRLFWPKWDRPDKKTADEMSERALKAAIVSHGTVTKEQAIAATGALNVTEAMFKGRQAFVAYDPPPAGSPKGVYSKVIWLDEATFKEILSGKRPISWPQDRASAKAKTQAAMGAPGTSVAGGMIPQPNTAPAQQAAPAGFGTPAATPAAAPAATPAAAPVGGGGFGAPPAGPTAASLAPPAPTPAAVPPTPAAAPAAGGWSA